MQTWAAQLSGPILWYSITHTYTLCDTHTYTPEHIRSIVWDVSTVVIQSRFIPGWYWIRFTSIGDIPACLDFLSSIVKVLCKSLPRMTPPTRSYTQTIILSCYSLKIVVKSVTSSGSPSKQQMQLCMHWNALLWSVSGSMSHHTEAHCIACKDPGSMNHLNHLFLHRAVVDRSNGVSVRRGSKRRACIHALICCWSFVVCHSSCGIGGY
jgi:hypothetical protein